MILYFETHYKTFLRQLSKKGFFSFSFILGKNIIKKGIKAFTRKQKKNPQKIKYKKQKTK